MPPCPTDLSFHDSCGSMKYDFLPSLSVDECNKSTSSGEDSFNFSLANFNIASAPKLPGRFHDSKNKTESSFFFSDSASFLDSSTNELTSESFMPKTETSSLAATEGSEDTTILDSVGNLPEGNNSSTSWRFTIQDDSDHSESYDCLDISSSDGGVEEAGGMYGEENNEDEPAPLQYTPQGIKSKSNHMVFHHIQNLHLRQASNKFSNGCVGGGPLRLPVRSQSFAILETLSEANHGRPSKNDVFIRWADSFAFWNEARKTSMTTDSP